MGAVCFANEDIEATHEACYGALGVSRLKAKQREAISSFVNRRDVIVLTNGVWEITLLPLVFD